MGACASVSKESFRITRRRSKTDRHIVRPESPIKISEPPAVDFAVNSLNYSDVKDETYFDTNAWLDSDCEDDFYSVRGDFTPSRGNTPVHHLFSVAQPQVNEPPVEASQTRAVDEASQTPAVLDASHTTTVLEASHTTTVLEAVEAPQSPAVVKVLRTPAVVEVPDTPLVDEVSRTPSAVEVSRTPAAVEVLRSLTAVEVSPSPAVSELSPTSKKSLSELLRDTAREDEEVAEVENTMNGKSEVDPKLVETGEVPLVERTASIESARCCMPKFVSYRSFNDRKRMSPATTVSVSG